MKRLTSFVFSLWLTKAVWALNPLENGENGYLLNHALCVGDAIPVNKTCPTPPTALFQA